MAVVMGREAVLWVEGERGVNGSSVEQWTVVWAEGDGGEWV